MLSKTEMSNKDVIAIIASGTISKKRKDEKISVYRLALEMCARKDDNIGMTIFSSLIREEKEIDLANKMRLTVRALRSLKKDYLNKLMLDMLYLVPDAPPIAAPPRYLQHPLEQREPGYFITNKLNISSMINCKAYTLFAQNLSIEQTKELLAKASMKDQIYQSHVGIDVMCNLFSDLFDYPIEFNRGYIRFIPGDVIIYVQYIGPFVDSNMKQLPVNSKINITYLELDEVDPDDILKFDRE